MSSEHLTEIMQLSVSERLQLVADIWDSIAAMPDAIPLTEAQRRELDRRFVEYKHNPEAGIPWDRVKEKIQSLR